MHTASTHSSIRWVLLSANRMIAALQLGVTAIPKPLQDRVSYCPWSSQAYDRTEYGSASERETEVSVQWGSADTAGLRHMSRIEPARIGWYMYRSLRLGDDPGLAIGCVRRVFALVVDGIAFGIWTVQSGVQVKGHWKSTRKEGKQYDYVSL